MDGTKDDEKGREGMARFPKASLPDWDYASLAEKMWCLTATFNKQQLQIGVPVTAAARPHPKHTHAPHPPDCLRKECKFSTKKHQAGGTHTLTQPYPQP